MIIPFLRRNLRRSQGIPHELPRDLPSHIMRDIGLDPWPETASRRFHPLW
ncbi:hypothetical protein [Defluviimonas sp. WL0075]|uniref:DUF1127 domain-containing protein n=1 Tax=Albidovulum sediminicola TaxID=2984331 RepID=A0ABT2Z683_9RHOB|nr:hypothetical protein [Defluviimonas sp. WL0075]MCV2866652.1 hypothetical protein [Defluviimonas sp. WL0075]